MIYTSYFAKLKKMPNNIIPISICGKAPEFYKGLQYKKLAPKYGFFMEWKKNHNNDFYIEHYNDEVLSKLNPYDILLELYNLLSNEQKQVLKTEKRNIWNSQKIHIALLCYEKPSDFCHRHLLAKWLNKYGFECKEWIK